MAFFCTCGHPMELHTKMAGRCTVRGNTETTCNCSAFTDRSKLAATGDLDGVERRPADGGVETR